MMILNIRVLFLMILIWGYVKNDLYDCLNEVLIMLIMIFFKWECNIVFDKFVKCMYVMLLIGFNFVIIDFFFF